MIHDPMNLYLDEALLEAAQQAIEREPIVSALAFLQTSAGEPIRQKPAPTRRDKHATQPVLRRPTTPQEDMLVNAYRFWLLGQEAAGLAATTALFETRYGLTEAPTIAEALRQWVSAMHIADLLHTEPHFARDAAAWHEAAAQRLTELRQRAGNDLMTQAWLHLATLVASSRDADTSQSAGALGHLRAIIDQIHPEGYIKAAVNTEDPQQNFQQMLMVTGVLCLAAELAERMQGSLWSYQNRGVGISTAVAYVVSFYFYPEKWRWGGKLEADFVTEQFQQHGAFLEMAARRAPLRATDILLEDLRPMFSLSFGGLTTFTHGAPPEPEPKKRRFLW